MPLTLQRRPTDIVALVRQVIAEQQGTTGRHNIQLEASTPEIMGNWDAERLERAVTNLVSNAIKYSPDGGDITVRVAREASSEDGSTGEEGSLTIEVTDHGLGISQEDLPHIFEWFRRASNVSGRISGAGIGLASSLHAIRQHGGTIEVESELGTGSTFTMRLPVGLNSQG
jgi:signal transduction histidine kinase